MLDLQVAASPLRLLQLQTYVSWNRSYNHYEDNAGLGGLEGLIKPPFIANLITHTLSKCRRVLSARSTRPIQRLQRAMLRGSRAASSWASTAL